jgi:exodeoxyribonuclease VII large subunit
MSARRVVDSAAQPVSKVGLSADAPLAVARFVSHLDKRIREKVLTQGYWLTGDVVELRSWGRGALSFELCDHETRVACIVPELFSSRATSVLVEGQRAVVFANIELGDRDGRVRLAVTDVQDHGVGAEQRKLARLREALQREGLFKAERKRRIPERPAAIALITSESGAARHDFVAAATRRHPGVSIVLIPAAMQGPTAAQAIIDGMLRATRTCCEVVIVARGGGATAPIASVFNDEVLVRAVADCRLPVVTAIGHQTDRFLVDDVADLSVSTPTAAAERIVPDRAALLAALTTRRNQAIRVLGSRLQRSRERLGGLRERLSLVAPSRVARQRALLATTYERLRRHAMRPCHRDRQMLDKHRNAWKHCVTRRLQRERTRLDHLGAVLDALNPQAVLARGFAFLTDAQGQVVSGVADVREARELTVRLYDGYVSVVVYEPDHTSL